MATGVQPPPLLLSLGDGEQSSHQLTFPTLQLIGSSSSNKQTQNPNHHHQQMSDDHQQTSGVHHGCSTPLLPHAEPSKVINNLLSNQSYVEVVKGCSLKGADSSLGLRKSQALDMESMALKPISLYQGKPAVVFPLSEKLALVDKLRFVLVGKFSHGMPSLVKTKKFFNSLKLVGFCNVTVFDKKHIFIDCSCKADFNYIWMQLSWAIEGFVMRVFKWTADFHPVKESAVIPVWIRLEGLPLYMFDEMPLMSIANTIGKPLKVDPRNVARTMVNSARVCVELDLSMPLADSLWISFEDDVSKEVREGFWARVFYDVVPHFCDFCSHIGHSAGKCKRKMEKALEMAPMRVDADVHRNLQDRQDMLVPNCKQAGVLESGVTVESSFSKDKAKQEIAGHLGAADGFFLGKNCSRDKAQQGHIKSAAVGSLLGSLEGSTQAGLGHGNMPGFSGQLPAAKNTLDRQHTHVGQVISGAADGLGTACSKAGAQQGANHANIVTLDDNFGHGNGDGEKDRGDFRHLDGDGANGREAKSILQVEGMLAKKQQNSGTTCKFQLEKETSTAEYGHSMCKQAGRGIEPAMEQSSVLDKQPVELQNCSLLQKQLELEKSAESDDKGNQESPLEVDGENEKEEGGNTKNDFIVTPTRRSWADSAEEEEKEAQIRIISQLSLSEVEDFAKKEIEKIWATPIKGTHGFDTSRPIISNPYILDKEGRPVPCSEVIRKSIRLSAVRSYVDKVKQGNTSPALKDKAATLKEKWLYDKLMNMYTEQIHLTIKDHQQTIPESGDDSTRFSG